MGELKIDPGQAIVGNPARRNRGNLKIQENIEMETAGFWVRVFASSVDTMISLSASILLSYLVSRFYLNQSLLDTLQKNSVLLNIVFGLVQYSYNVVGVHKFGKTIGKHIFKLKVLPATEDSEVGIIRAIVRETIGKYISAIILCIGFIMAGFKGKNKNKCLHDYIANTVVIYDK